MKALVLLVLCIALAGCARAPELPTSGSTGLQGDSSDPQARETSEMPSHVLVVELRAAAAEEQAACRREQDTGSRIIRRRCRQPLSESEARLQAESARMDLDYAREMALLQEQRRMALEQQRRQETQDAMRRMER